MKTEKEILDNALKANERKNRIAAGYFDGRFRPRIIKNKKKHQAKYAARTNKIKHQ